MIFVLNPNHTSMMGFYIYMCVCVKSMIFVLNPNPIIMMSFYECWLFKNILDFLFLMGVVGELLVTGDHSAILCMVLLPVAIDSSMEQDET